MFFFIIIYLLYLRKDHLEYQVLNSERYKKKVNIFKVEDIHKSSLLILGDSRFESVNTNLKNAINLSVGGETSNTLFKRIQNYNFRDSIKIIIGIGLNDALFSYSSSLALYNMNRLLTKIFKKTNNSKIYICEILPINSDGFFYKKEPINLLLNKSTNKSSLNLLDSISLLNN